MRRWFVTLVLTLALGGLVTSSLALVYAMRGLPEPEQKCYAVWSSDGRYPKEVCKTVRASTWKG